VPIASGSTPSRCQELASNDRGRDPQASQETQAGRGNLSNLSHSSGLSFSSLPSLLPKEE